MEQKKNVVQGWILIQIPTDMSIFFNYSFDYHS